MYNFEWHSRSRGYKLQTGTGKFVASEIRPVYAAELTLLKAEAVFEFNADENLPILWGKHNSYIYKGVEVAKAQRDENGSIRLIPIEPGKRIKLDPVDMDLWLSVNEKIMDALVADTLKRIKEMYDRYRQKTDVCYIGFSGGKDSMVLLDLCHKVLPMTVPVVYSDTDMELPDSYKTWNLAKDRYVGRPFVMVKAGVSALENWKSFGPPSQNLRWCCAVHKSTPAIMYLRELAKSPSARTLAFVGVRSDESVRRSTYDDIGDGLKSQSQVNAMPILNWGAHELFLYTYSQRLIINDAYKKGLPRVGCLLCPMSNDRQVDVIRSVYPNEVKVYEQAIRETIEREFATDRDFEDFIYKDKGWHARQSGVTLKGVVQSPVFEKKENHGVYSFGYVSKRSLIEWLKTVGSIKESDDGETFLLKTQKEEISLKLSYNGEGVIGIDCSTESSRIDKTNLKYLRSSICKALGCIGCRACESECPTGALSFAGRVNVDVAKCVHCMRCHATNDGCMRYFSKRYAGGTTMNISGINKYMTFGLKQEYLDVLLSEREQFRATTALGNRMTPTPERNGGWLMRVDGT